MAVSVRIRFEVFKRDNFTCRYCGLSSPEIILELDHILPRADGGSDDLLNLATSCFACNRGKSDRPLNERQLGEDPHDRAVFLLEQERQMAEYNYVQATVSDRVNKDYKSLKKIWPRPLAQRDRTWLRRTLESIPAEAVLAAMDAAVEAGKTSGLAYVNACLRNRREKGEFPWLG
jgi:hypothetical protein